MKKSIFVLMVIVLTFATQSCKKQPQPVADPYGTFGTDVIGTATGLTYGDSSKLPRPNMTLTVKAGRQRNCDKPLYFITIYHDSLDLFQENIIFGNLPLGKTGKFPITYRREGNGVTNFCVDFVTCSFILINGGDLLVGDYSIDNTYQSFIDIQKYDTQTNEIEGTFDVTLFASGTSEQSRLYYVNTVRFHGCRFKTRINQ
jgi:hypothetical protein